eukprot:UN23886
MDGDYSQFALGEMCEADQAGFMGHTNGYCYQCANTGPWPANASNINNCNNTFDVYKVVCRGLCPANHYVMNHQCNPCAPGKSSPAGYDAAGPNKWCKPIICEENEFVYDHECHPCHPGYKNWAGDRATDGNTMCEPIICHANEHVMNHKCEPCPSGEKNIAGDRAAGEDTHCHDASLVCTYEAVDESECPEEGCEGPDEVGCLQQGLDDILCPQAVMGMSDPRRSLGLEIDLGLGANDSPQGANDSPLGANDSPLGANDSPLGANDVVIEGDLFCYDIMEEYNSDRRQLQENEEIEIDFGEVGMFDGFFQLGVGEHGCQYMMLDFDCGLKQCPEDIYDTHLADDELCELDLKHSTFEEQASDLFEIGWMGRRNNLDFTDPMLISNCGDHDVYRKVCQKIEVIRINIFWYFPALDIASCQFVLDTGLLHQAFANWTGVPVENIFLECNLGLDVDIAGVTRRDLKESERNKNSEREHHEKSELGEINNLIDELEVRNLVEFILADGERNGGKQSGSGRGVVPEFPRERRERNNHH